jgi:hypothetical protein
VDRVLAARRIQATVTVTVIIPMAVPLAVRSAIRDLDFNQRGELRIAVGTFIAERPPQLSVRAQFGHTAPTLGV